MDSKVIYWNNEAVKFNSIYHEDGKVKGWLNKLLRSDMEGRYIFALKGAHLDSRPNILEIGCGTGIHTKGFLDSGASSVTGVDLSPEMLKIAAVRLGKYESRFKLMEGDFLKLKFERAFDVVTAIGVFDYIADPLTFMKKAMSLTNRCFIASFPRSGTLRSRLRSIRLGLKGCPVYFYSEKQLTAMSDECGAVIAEHEIIGQLHCVIFAGPGEQAAP
ncbi:MAG: class I SAM-dependent methyltransferase [Synergistaceae bacterium]|nr:class I SAM-dependent methyltransferase [Synergistaceae bacterium]